MNLVGLSFNNYKAFAGRESIEIRPLTVLIGKNSSGKSAIARLPLMLAGALAEQAEAPLPVQVHGVDFGASFLDLVHNRRPHAAIELGATFEEKGERFELRAKVQYHKDVKVQVVAELHIDTRAGRYSLVRLDQNPLEERALYRMSSPDLDQIELRLRWHGLRIDLPSRVDDAQSERIEIWRWGKVFGDVLAQAGYLGPFRTAPQRDYRYPGGLPESVGRNGNQAPQLLAADALRMGGEVVKAVGQWYRDFLGGWTLDVAHEGEKFALVLRAPNEPDVTVNLVDVGTGLSQVLPLVVQRQFEEVTNKGFGGLEIIEQPELHLHPAAHVNLADLYIEATKRAGCRFLIETHSENFILRIRRKIAERKLDPSWVRIYSVEEGSPSGATLKPITILPDGEVDYWPKGVFSEDYEEFKAIRKAQKAR